MALLGNYETALLTDEARERLVSLLSFSFTELRLHPLSSSDHRGENLRAISGHRDGCATLCPGRNVYELLPEIRNEVLESLQHCRETLVLNYAVDRQNITTGDRILFENTSTGYEAYRWTFEGGTPESSEAAMPEIAYNNPGLFSVTLYGTLGNQVDSLVVMNSIQVEGTFPAPNVYPHPLNIGTPFQIDFTGDLQNIYLYSLSGQLVARYQPSEDTRYQAPAIAGFYTLVMETTSETFAQKFVVR